jgi:hypothetical protein
MRAREGHSHPKCRGLVRAAEKIARTTAPTIKPTTTGTPNARKRAANTAVGVDANFEVPEDPADQFVRCSTTSRAYSRRWTRHSNTSSTQRTSSRVTSRPFLQRSKRFARKCSGAICPRAPVSTWLDSSTRGTASRSNSSPPGRLPSSAEPPISLRQPDRGLPAAVPREASTRSAVPSDRLRRVDRRRISRWCWKRPKLRRHATQIRARGRKACVQSEGRPHALGRPGRRSQGV